MALPDINPTPDAPSVECTCVFDVATSQITVTDSTTYPILWKTVSYAKVNLARALFYSIDEFDANAVSDLTNPVAYEWVFGVIVPNTYRVKAYFVPYHASVNALAPVSWEVIYYNGHFRIYNTNAWFELSVGAALDLAAIGGETYASLTDIDIYNIFQEAFQRWNIVGVHSQSVETASQAYTLTKTDCNTWEVEYLFTSTTVSSARLLNYDSDLLETLTPAGNTIGIDLSLYGDGAYILEVTLSDASIIYIVIYEICDAQSCYKALLKYLICSCGDPCDDCDEGNAVRQRDLNSLMTLMEALKEMIYLEKYQNLGIYTMDDSREAQVAEVGVMIDKLAIITDRCGLCDDTTDNVITC